MVRDPVELRLVLGSHQLYCDLHFTIVSQRGEYLINITHRQLNLHDAIIYNNKYCNDAV